MGGAKLKRRPRKTRSSIEEIPQELLVKIISLLSFKDAVKASIISRRWRHLWKHIPNLVIDSHNVLSLENDLMLTMSMQRRLKAGERRADGVSTKITEEFIDGANSILLNHHGVLDSLEIKFFLNGEHAIYLDQWISCALASRAKKLVLNLRSPHEERYNFPCHLLSKEPRACSLECLELKFCSLESPIQEFEGFRNLTTLRLESVDDVVEKLLPECVAVKDLSFVSCNRLLDLRIPIALCKLEILNVSFCGNIRMVECYVPNLSTFIYNGGAVPLIFKELEKTSIVLTWGDFSSLIDYLTQVITSVKSLIFQTYSRRVKIWGATVESPERKLDTRALRCPHDHLKSVTMDGFTGYNIQLELASFLVANATQLEKLTIHTSSRYSIFGSKLKMFPCRIEVARRRFYELFRPQLPQHVKLFVL